MTEINPEKEEEPNSPCIEPTLVSRYPDMRMGVKRCDPSHVRHSVDTTTIVQGKPWKIYSTIRDTQPKIVSSDARTNNITWLWLPYSTNCISLYRSATLTTPVHPFGGHYTDANPAEIGSPPSREPSWCHLGQRPLVSNGLQPSFLPESPDLRSTRKDRCTIVKDGLDGLQHFLLALRGSLVRMGCLERVGDHGEHGERRRVERRVEENGGGDGVWGQGQHNLKK